MRRLFITILAALLLLSGCDDLQGPVTTSPPTTPSTVAPTTTPPTLPPAITPPGVKPPSSSVIATPYDPASYPRISRFLTYDFSSVTPYATRNSAGTGGKEYRGYQGDIWEAYDFDSTLQRINYRELGEEYSWVTPDVDSNQLRAQNMANQELQDDINEFLMDSFRFFTDMNADYFNSWSGNAYPLVAITVGGYGEGGYLEFCEVYDLVLEKRLQLSDLFYDDFNFIVWLNQELSGTIYSPGWWSGSSEDNVLKRPFSGIAADYPHFSLYPGSVSFTFLPKNPFFNSMWYLSAELTSDISPYGNYYPYGVWRINRRQRSLAEHLILQTMQISIDGNQAASAKINAQLSTIFDEITEAYAAQLGSYLDLIRDYNYGSDYYYSIYEPVRQPDLLFCSSGVQGPYLAVNFQFLGIWLGQSNIPQVQNVYFDLRSGEMVDLVSLMNSAEDLPIIVHAYSVPYLRDGNVILEDTFWNDQDPYVPPAGSQLIGIQYWSDQEYQLYFRESDGRIVLAHCVGTVFPVG